MDPRASSAFIEYLLGPRNSLLQGLAFNKTGGVSLSNISTIITQIISEPFVIVN